MKHALDIAFERWGLEREEKRAVEVAKKLLAKGMSVDEIVDATGLDLNTVLKLQY